MLLNQLALLDIEKALAKSLGIVPEVTLKEYLRKRTKPLFTVSAILDGREKVIFRLALDEVHNHYVEREIKIYEIAAQAGLSFFPDLVKHGTFRGHCWLMYRYINGEPAGNTYEFKSDVAFSAIVNVLSGLKQLNKNKFSGMLTDHSNDKLWWEKLYGAIISKGGGLLREDRIKSAMEKIEGHLGRSAVLPVLTHGDLHPQNIFLNQTDIKIIDWETVHLNSPAFDYSFLWIRSFNEEARQKLWERMKKDYPRIEDEAKIIFLMNIIRDIFEWKMIEKGNNELLNIEKRNNAVTPSERIENLLDQIKHFV